MTRMPRGRVLVRCKALTLVIAIVLVGAACQSAPEPTPESAAARAGFVTFVAQIAPGYGLDDDAQACVVEDLVTQFLAATADLRSRDVNEALRSCGQSRGRLLGDLGLMLGADAASCLDGALTKGEVADIFDGGYLQEGPMADTVTDLGDAALALHPQCAP